MDVKYFELFQEIKNLYKDDILELGIYEGCFADYYDMFEADPAELDLYLSQASQCGKHILELCCGNGRLTVPFAMQRFHVDGCDLSRDMLKKLETRKNSLPKSLQKNICVFNQDVFEIETENKYDFICLPATTVCIISDDEDKLKNLFSKVHFLLSEDGRFVFDMRTYPIEDERSCSLVSSFVRRTEDTASLTLCQEFINYSVGRSITNLYTQIERRNERMEKYIAYADKKIISRDWIEGVLSGAGFKIHDEISSKCDGADVIYMILKKA